MKPPYRHGCSAAVTWTCSSVHGPSGFEAVRVTILPPARYAIAQTQLSSLRTEGSPKSVSGRIDEQLLPHVPPLPEELQHSYEPLSKMSFDVTRWSIMGPTWRPARTL